MQPDSGVPSFDGLPPAEAVRLARVWDLVGEAPLPPLESVPSTEEAWAALAPRLQPTRRRPRAADRPPSRPRRIPLVATSALLAVALLAIGLWWAHAPVATHVPAGGQATVLLPDGSTVELAGDTRVSFQRGFRTFPLRAAAERAVRLEGEAFFMVVPGEQPFVVRTHNAVVEVVGTSFNVRARAEDAVAATRVTVAGGLVRVADAAGESVVVREREAVEVAAGRMVATMPAPEAVAVWREGGFAIHEQPLADVLREIERRFGVTVRGAADLPYDLPLTLYYSRAVDAETVLHDIALAADLQYRPLRGGYEVIHRPPPSR
jgi:transmembrane sensor